MAGDPKLQAKKAGNTVDQATCCSSASTVQPDGGRVHMGISSTSARRDPVSRRRIVGHRVGFSHRDNCYIINPLCYDLDGCAAIANLFNLLLILGVHRRE